MIYYINRTGNGYAETVDETSSKLKAEYLRREYQISDSRGRYSVSTRPCSNWEGEAA